MQGIHDLGGLEGFGRVEVEPDEPVFHHDWERRTLGLAFAAFVLRLNRDTGQFRHSIERMDAVHYLTSSYYEHWLTGLATRLVEKGHVTVEELEDKAGGRFPLSRPVAGPDGEDDRSELAEPRFNVCDTVRVRFVTSRGHTRCPGYVQGRVGAVVRVDPASYCVRFDGVFGDGPTSDPVHVDLWESYVQPA